MSGAASPQLQHSFCMLVLIFLVLMGLCICNRPFQRLKRRNMRWRSALSLMLAYQKGQGEVSKPNPQTLPVFWIELMYRSVIPQGLAMQQSRNVVPMAFFSSLSRYALKQDLGWQSSHGRVVLLKSLVLLWAWGLENPFPKRLYVPFQGRNQIWCALLWCYPAMISRLLLFELAGCRGDRQGHINEKQKVGGCLGYQPGEKRRALPSKRSPVKRHSRI